MTTLTKDFRTIITEGSPGAQAIPGYPAVPTRCGTFKCSEVPYHCRQSMSCIYVPPGTSGTNANGGRSNPYGYFMCTSSIVCS